MRSWRDPAGHIARVRASGPNSSRDGAEEVQAPLPRLQSIRALTRPSVPNAIVYLFLSSGVRARPSPPSNFTSLQDVPPRPAVVSWGTACAGGGTCGADLGSSCPGLQCTVP